MRCMQLLVILALTTRLTSAQQNPSFENEATTSNRVISNQPKKGEIVDIVMSRSENESPPKPTSSLIKVLREKRTRIRETVYPLEPKRSADEPRQTSLNSPSDGIPPRDWRNIGSSGVFYLLPDCSMVLRQCVKPCVCYDCQKSHQLIVDCSCKSLTFIPVGIPSNVTHLQLKNNQISQVQSSSFESLKALEVLDLSNNELKRLKNRSFVGQASLKMLLMNSNACYELRVGFFVYFKSLQELKIGDNFLGPVLENGVFDGLNSLLYLDIHSNRLEEITTGLFADVQELRDLDLSENFISSWNAEISRLKHLARLDLTSNKFSSLPRKLLQDLDKISEHNNISISLKGNPLKCNCDTKYFIDWIFGTRVNLEHAKTTVCVWENGTQTVLTGSNLEITFNYLKVHCRTFTALIVVSACIILIVIGVATGKALHRYRWKLRYLYYMTVNTGERTGYEHLGGDDRPPLTFDAFVSYEDSDRDFVRQQILPKMETEAGLRLCIDKINFIPGFYIADNIMNAIQNSKKTVVLLSKNFLQSKWCMYEFNMARMESIYSDRNSLLVVLMEDIPAKDVPAEVLQILHSKSYITKTDDPDGIALFWRQLTAGIRLKKIGDVAVI